MKREFKISQSKDGNLLFKESEWTNYVVGIFVTNKSEGFFKVYQNEELVLHWSGPTYGWTSDKIKTFLRIGPYRDGDPNKGKEYVPQTIYYDDFVVGDSEKWVTDFLWK